MITNCLTCTYLTPEGTSTVCQKFDYVYNNFKCSDAYLKLKEPSTMWTQAHYTVVTYIHT